MMSMADSENLTPAWERVIRLQDPMEIDPEDYR